MLHAVIAAVGIMTGGADAIMIVIPIAVIVAFAVLVPTLMFPIVVVVVPIVPIIAIVAVVTILPVVVPILSWVRDRQGSSQCHPRLTCNYFPHSASLLEKIEKTLRGTPFRPISTLL